jgi:uncharacterized protein (TIGR00245 family)
MVTLGSASLINPNVFIRFLLLLLLLREGSSLNCQVGSVRCRPDVPNRRFPSMLPSDAFASSRIRQSACYSDTRWIRSSLLLRHPVTYLSLKAPNTFSLLRDDSHPTTRPSTIGHRVCFLGWILLATMSAAILTVPTLASASSSSSSMAISAATQHPLGPANVAKAAALVLLTAGCGLSAISGVPTLARALIQACARSTVQLFLFGGTILTHLLVKGQTRPWLVWGWIALTVCVAAREACSRVEYTYPQLPLHLLLAIGMGGGLIISMTVALSILGPVHPWYSPRVWIPVSGMMLGNALTGTALAAKTVTKEFATHADQVELRLTQGATWREAIALPLRTVFTTSLTPLMNFLSAAGIVHVPGLMTGQILAGQSPVQATMYQMLVFMLMASTTCTSVQILIRLAVSALIDRRNDRLQLATLHSATQPWRWGRKRNFLIFMLSAIPQFGFGAQKRLRRILFRKSSEWRRRHQQFSYRSSHKSERGRSPYYAHMPVYSVVLNRTVSEIANNSTLPSPAAIVSLRKMRVARTNMDVTLDLRYDDRIALTGQSGIGKSQVLRTLAGLEVVDRTAIRLFDIPAAQMSMAEWRSHVVLVPQQRPSLEGTPNDFHNQLVQYQSQSKKKRARNVISGYYRLHTQYGADWGIAESLFDRPWSQLSGGESQRIVLAIALSLQPDVLLLDESTSALDERTEMRVEATLRKLRIPVLMVSHSKTQVQRFCNHQLSLERAQNAQVPELSDALSSVLNRRI